MVILINAPPKVSIFHIFPIALWRGAFLNPVPAFDTHPHTFPFSFPSSFRIRSCLSTSITQKEEGFHLLSMKSLFSLSRFDFSFQPFLFNPRIIALGKSMICVFFYRKLAMELLCEPFHASSVL